MSVAVTGDLVCLAGDLADEVGMSGGDLAQDKKGGPGSAGGQQSEHTICARLDAALETGPRSVRPFLEDLGVEVLFHVHAEGIHDVARRVHRSAHSATTLPCGAGIRHVALRVSITSEASSTTWR